MKRHYRLLLVLLPVLAGAAVWWAVTPREPAYGGKSLSRWIAVIKAGPYAKVPRYGSTPTEDEAIWAMGLKALPGLLESVRARDYEPWWSATYRRCFLHLPPGLQGVLPAPAPLDPARESSFQYYVVNFCDGLWPQSKPLLIRTLRHPRAEVRSTAIMALRWRTNHQAELLPALTNLLQDPDGEVRVWVHTAIANYGPAASNAVPAIVDNLLSRHRPAGFNPSESEQVTAADALGRMGPAAVAAVPVLQAGAAQQTYPCYRVTCAIALWRIRHHAPDALPILVQEFQRSPDMFKPMILDCFGEMGTAAAGAVPDILQFLASPPNPNDFEDDVARQKAREALRKIAPDAAAKRQRKVEKREP
ncbi:MAG TPA: HEAT repeat domain-containing protein [Candidatus Limnocylindria bacterium]|jgi:hypothetical protein|nr:HEAT repeat domain-containing protein [Candidatus Limnocylindria bacterium]